MLVLSPNRIKDPAKVGKGKPDGISFKARITSEGQVSCFHARNLILDFLEIRG
jgi:hypothetical protein